MRKRRIGTAKFFTLLLLLYHTSANPQRREAVLVQKLVGARRRYAQRAGDKLRVEKQRQLVKILDA